MLEEITILYRPTGLSSPPVKPLRFYAWGYKGVPCGGAMGEGRIEQKSSFWEFPLFSAILFIEYKRKEKWMKAFKYRLYVTKGHAEKLEWTLSRCCELYNAGLQERKEIWTVCKKHPNFYDPEWYARL